MTKLTPSIGLDDEVDDVRSASFCISGRRKLTGHTSIKYSAPLLANTAALSN